MAGSNEEDDGPKPSAETSRKLAIGQRLHNEKVAEKIKSHYWGQTQLEIFWKDGQVERIRVVDVVTI